MNGLGPQSGFMEFYGLVIRPAGFDAPARLADRRAAVATRRPDKSRDGFFIGYCHRE
jgi:hypothetical protein